MHNGQTKKSNQSKEQEHFDKLVSQTGEVWWGHRTPAGKKRLQRRAEIVGKALADFNDPLVLDLGCGTGISSQYVLEALPVLRLVGCDISPKAVEAAKLRYRKYPNARYEVADTTAMPYADNTFDAVIGNSILHHVPTAETLAECFRVLKPGGVLVCFEPNMMNPIIAIEKNLHFIGKFMEDSEDETAFSHWQAARMLRDTGYGDVRVTPFDFLFPLTPQPFIGAVSVLGKALERLPLVKEISGSLHIFGKKPV